MKIQDNQIIADTGKFIARKGSDIYFSACTLLQGETVDNFIEVDHKSEEGLSEARQELINRIDEFDKSSAVNVFYYHGYPMWFAKADRVGLRNSLEIEQRCGRESSTMWLGDMPITVKITEGLQLLDAIELYALDCYNVTARHKAEAEKLMTIAECESYDYTQGYPDKLEL